MKILDLLGRRKAAPLITFRNHTLTQDQFSEAVTQATARLHASGFEPEKRCVLLREEDPISFYTALFALWSCGCRVVFPTRELFAGRWNFTCWDYAAGILDGEVVLERNDSFEPAAVDDDVDTIAFSSGSTGHPKGIAHRRDNFLNNALSVLETVTFSGYQTVTTLKPYLVSAVSHFLVHFLSDSHLIFVDFDRPESIGEIFGKNGATALAGSPVQVVSGEHYIPRGASPLFFFSSGDFIHPPAIARILEDFPKTTFFKVYGLAEMAGRCFVREISNVTAPEDYESIGTCIRGINYRVSDREIFMNADFMFSGYLQGGRYSRGGSWHPTGDLVGTGERGMYLRGRAGSEIKVAGNKVSLTFVESRIASVLGAGTAVCVATPHPYFGNTVSLVLGGESHLSRSRLLGLLGTALEKHLIPHSFYRTDSIPLTQTGKIDRKRLAEMLPGLEKIDG